MLKIFKSASQLRNERFASQALERQATFTREAVPADAGAIVTVTAEVHAYKRFGGRDLDMNGSSFVNCVSQVGGARGAWTEDAGCHVLLVTGTPEEVTTWLHIYER
jgi:hypothetical protein